MHFRTLVADPPWPYESAGIHAYDPRTDDYVSTVSSVERYGSMTMDELKALPVKPLMATNAHAYIWTTNGFLIQAFDLAKAWGFDVKTMLTWTKMRQDGEPSCGVGYYYRGATEHCLFCVRGSLPLIGKIQRPTGFIGPRLPHSVKPDWFYDLVDEQSPGPILELFARRARPGWYHWGNQAPDSVDLVELAKRPQGTLPPPRNRRKRIIRSGFLGES